MTAYGYGYSRQECVKIVSDCILGREHFGQWNGWGDSSKDDKSFKVFNIHV